MKRNPKSVKCHFDSSTKRLILILEYIHKISNNGEKEHIV